MAATRWHDWAQVVGIFALVGSLIFVGLQMQQTQEIALAEQYQARAEAAQAMMLAQMETGESIFMFGGTPREEWSPKQQAIDSLVTSWAWTQFDNHFYQYQAGFLDDDAWAGMRRRIKNQYDRCGSRRLWKFHRRFLRPSFVAHVEALEDVCTEPAALGGPQIPDGPG
jgi:hypothetical protein